MPQKVAYSPEEIEGSLTTAGFVDIDLTGETSDIVFETDEDFWAFQLTMGSRVAIYRLSEEVRARFKEEYLGQLRSLLRSDGLHLPAPVIYARARKPNSGA